MSNETRMQVLFITDLALSILILVTVGIRTIKQKVRRKPVRYDHID